MRETILLKIAALDEKDRLHDASFQSALAGLENLKMSSVENYENLKVEHFLYKAKQVLSSTLSCPSIVDP